MGKRIKEDFEKINSNYYKSDSRESLKSEKVFTEMDNLSELLSAVGI
jgi:hypothetical protein